MLEWSGRRIFDNDTECHVHQAKLNGESISVRFSAEVMEDHGSMTTLTSVAEAKILAAAQSGTVPKEVLVTNADVR
jgi:hypothetical protein